MPFRKLLLSLTILVVALSASGSAPATPRAAYVVRPSSPVAGQPAKLAASQTACDDGPCTYRWSSLVRGGKRHALALGRARTLSHTFWRPGKQIVRLTIRNRNGQESSSTRTITVWRNPGCHARGRQRCIQQLPPGVTLRNIDGGPHYFRQFTNAKLFDHEIPIADWGAYNFTAANTANDAGEGINIHAQADNLAAADWAAMQKAGIHVWPSSHDWDDAAARAQPNVSGYGLGDEIDMKLHAGHDQWLGQDEWNSCNPPVDQGGGCGYTAMETKNEKLPHDGKLRYTEYGKFVQFSGDDMLSGWAKADEAAGFVNGDAHSPTGYQDVISAEVYFYSDRDSGVASQGGTFYNNGATDLTLDQRRRASNYGLLVDRLRGYDARDGKRQAVLGFVELGLPDANADRTIQPDEVKAAVWHSLIAGARGIVYFQYSFSGPCPTQTILQDTSGCYTSVQQAVKTVNARVQRLAPVLDSEFADGYVSVAAPCNACPAGTTTGVRAMAKKVAGGDFYVFAGNRDNDAKTATFTLAGGSSGTAEVVDEHRSIPISGGRFSDQFSSGTAIHIYRIHPRLR